MEKKKRAFLVLSLAFFVVVTSYGVNAADSKSYRFVPSDSTQDLSQFPTLDGLENDSECVKAIIDSEKSSKTPINVKAHEPSPKSTKTENSWTPDFKVNPFPFVLIAVLSVCSYLCMTVTRTARIVNKIPGAFIIPFIGTGYMFLGPHTAIQSTIYKYKKRYGSCVRFWKLHDPYVILSEPSHVEKILSSTIHINKGRDYNQLVWMNGRGLITSSGKVWRDDRKTLNPAFKFQKYEGFLECFNKHGRVFVKILHEMFANSSEMVNLHPTICKCTMDTILEGVLGQESYIQLETDDDKIDSLYHGAKIVMQSYRQRAFTPWLAWPIIRNIFGIYKEEQQTKKLFTDFITRVIEDRRKSLKDGKVEELASFMDDLLESRSNQNLVDHAFTIFAAGFETNATGMNFTLFLLALNPDAQAKVHEELDRVFGKGGKIRDPTFSDLSQLKYLELCILETMRQYPPAPLLTRSPCSDIKLDNGMVIPKGCDVVVFVNSLHNDPDLFPNPEKFEPERFLPENCIKRHNYAYIPFSKGPRNCIGQKYAMIQMKAVLAQILCEFTVSTNMKKDDIQMICGIVTEVDKELLMNLTPRHQSL